MRCFSRQLNSTYAVSSLSGNTKFYHSFEFTLNRFNYLLSVEGRSYSALTKYGLLSFALAYHMRDLPSCSPSLVVLNFITKEIILSTACSAFNKVSLLFYITLIFILIFNYHNLFIARPSSTPSLRIPW